MAKFKVGDRVRVIKDCLNECRGEAGTLTEVKNKKNNTYPYVVDVDGREHPYLACEKVGKIGRGRPKKPKPVKFIATYDTEDKDPHKTFTSKKELNEWLVREALEDEDVVFGSIKVYEVKKEFEIERSFKLKLV